MKLLHNKKGGIFDSISALGVGIAGLAITLVVTFLIISQTQTQLVTIGNIPNTTTPGLMQSVAGNATIAIGGAVAGVPGWVPLIVIAAIGAVLIGLVAMFRGGNK